MRLLFAALPIALFSLRGVRSHVVYNSEPLKRVHADDTEWSYIGSITHQPRLDYLAVGADTENGDTDATSVVFENVHHTVQFTPPGGTLTYGTDGYKLSQIHFHTPSEHLINSEYYPLEMHMVHVADADPKKILVLGVPFELSEDPAITTNLLTSLAGYVGQITTPGSTVTTDPVKKLPFDAIVKHLTAGKSLLEYSGSFTTPPCTEGVTWLVAAKTLPVNAHDLLAFKKVLKFNARYTQNAPNSDNLITLAVRNYPSNTAP